MSARNNAVMAGVSYISQGDIVPLVFRLRLVCVRAFVRPCLCVCLPACLFTGSPPPYVAPTSRVGWEGGRDGEYGKKGRKGEVEEGADGGTGKPILN